MNHKPVTIVMIEDDAGHAKLIEKNVRRAGVCNDIAHFADGGSALDYLFQKSVRDNGPVLILLDDTPGHPYDVAWETAMLAPKAELAHYPWKDPKELIPIAVRQVRSFLRAHRPAA